MPSHTVGNEALDCGLSPVHQASNAGADALAREALEQHLAIPDYLIDAARLRMKQAVALHRTMVNIMEARSVANPNPDRALGFEILNCEEVGASAPDEALLQALDDPSLLPTACDEIDIEEMHSFEDDMDIQSDNAFAIWGSD